MADSVMEQSYGLGEEEKSSSQLMKLSNSSALLSDWPKPPPPRPPPQVYVETSLDDLSYSSGDDDDDSSPSEPNFSGSPEPLASSGQLASNNQKPLTNQPNNFLYNNENFAETGSRQSADDAVERRLMEQIESAQEARRRTVEQEQRDHLQNTVHLSRQHQEGQQRPHQQLRQQVRSEGGVLGELDSQQAVTSLDRRHLMQSSPQRCNTFGRPHQLQPNEDQPPAVPVRRSSQAATRLATGESINLLYSSVQRNHQRRAPPSGLRRPSRSPPPPPVPPPGHHSLHRLPPRQPAPSQSNTGGGSLRLSRRLWSPASSSSEASLPPARSGSESSLNNLNALASNSTGEAARTLADCSTPSPQSTVVERRAQMELNQLVFGGAGVEPLIADGAEATQLEWELSNETQAPPSASTRASEEPLKQKPVVAAGESSNSMRSRSVVSLQRLNSVSATGLPSEEPVSASSRRLNQQQTLRSFSIACATANSGSLTLGQRGTHQQQQQVADCAEEHLRSKQDSEMKSGAKYWTLPAPQAAKLQPEAQAIITTNTELNGYALVDKSAKSGAAIDGKLPANLHTCIQPSPDQAVKSNLVSNGSTESCGECVQTGDNAIALGEQNLFPARLQASSSPQPANTCAYLCRFRGDKDADEDEGGVEEVAIALMPSEDEGDEEQQQQLMMSMGGAQPQEHSEQHQDHFRQVNQAPSSRLQDKWIRTMYKQMHRPSAENRHLDTVNSAHQQQQELPFRIQLGPETSGEAYPPTISPLPTDSDSFDAASNRRRPSDSPQPSSGTTSDYLGRETSRDRNLRLYYKLIKHIDDAFSSVLTNNNSRSSHTLQAPKRSRSSKSQSKMSKSGPQTPVAERSSNDQSSSIRVGHYSQWPQMSTDQHERRCVFSQLLKEELTTTTSTTKLPLKDVSDMLREETDQHKQYMAVQAGSDIPLKGLRKPVPPVNPQKAQTNTNPTRSRSNYTPAQSDWLPEEVYQDFESVYQSMWRTNRPTPSSSFKSTQLPYPVLGMASPTSGPNLEASSPISSLAPSEQINHRADSRDTNLSYHNGPALVEETTLSDLEDEISSSLLAVRECSNRKISGYNHGDESPPARKPVLDHMFTNESVHIHYRTPTGKLLKMNTLNEFEVNRLKKLYGKQMADGCPMERCKSGRLSSAHAVASGSSRHYKGVGATDDTSASPFVDLHRYQRAFLQPGRLGTRPSNSRTSAGTESIRFGRALFDFQAKSSGEMSLRRGDLVELLELIDHAWAQVEDCQSGLRGLVPLNYIDYSVGCAVAKRDVRHQGPTKLNATAANQPPYEQHLLPMSRGEPITLIRRLSGHLYEASNTRQALGLVWSRDLDIIKQPVLGTYTSSQSAQESDYCDARATEEDDQDDEEEMLILDSDEQFLTKRRRARSASGRPSAVISQTRQRDCCKDCCRSTATTSLPRRSSSSPYISGLQQQQHHHHHQQPPSPNKQLQRLYRAKYAYQPRQRDELELVAGDLLLVMHECDDGWFVGTSYSTNQMGIFPGNFIEPVQ